MDQRDAAIPQAYQLWFIAGIRYVCGDGIGEVHSAIAGFRIEQASASAHAEQHGDSAISQVQDCGFTPYPSPPGIAFHRDVHLA